MGCGGASRAVRMAHVSCLGGQGIGFLGTRSSEGLKRASRLNGQQYLPEEVRHGGPPTVRPWTGHHLPFLSPFPNLS